MKKLFSGILSFFLALLMLLSPAFAKEKTISVSAAQYPVTQDGWYSTMEEVSVYLATYGKLPGNYLTKKQAEAKGWVSREGNLNKVAPGCSIGGDRFGNYEGALPSQKGRTWTECDIDYKSGSRNGKRICFSNDGLIYYSDDHYNTFTQVVVSLDAPSTAETQALDPDGKYTSKDEVAAYLHQYGKLPSNYLTKSEAKKLGWTNKKDNLATVAPGCAIGGDVYQNREGLLPEADGRTWYECDVERTDGKRSKKRLLYSNDGLIYYTADAYKDVEKLY